MIALTDEYSVDVVEHDGSFVYQLLDGVDEVVAERVAGSAYTSSEEGMREIGNAMLEGLACQPKEARRISITITDDMREVVACNLVANAFKLKRRLQYRFKFTNGKHAIVRRRVRADGEERFTVRYEFDV